MKKTILALVMIFTMISTTDAMSYRQAREQALFLTDKMAYELNLTDEQYEAAFEINLDYLMSVDDYSDLYGLYWRRRNIDLGYVLLDWQYRAYAAAAYFFRPLYWNDGYWHFSIYARYPHREYYYFGQPTFYTSYRGGHSWRSNGNRSWYSGRNYASNYRYGMRDSYDRGDYGRHDNGNHYGWRNSTNSRYNNGNSRNNGFRLEDVNGRYDDNRRFGNGNRNSMDNHRESSTRTTVRRGDFNDNGGGTTFGGSRSGMTSGNVNIPNDTFSPGRSRSDNSSMSRSGGSYSSPRSQDRGSFGGSRQTDRGSFGTSRSSGNASNGNTSGSPRFGGRR